MCSAAPSEADADDDDAAAAEEEAIRVLGFCSGERGSVGEWGAAGGGREGGAVAVGGFPAAAALGRLVTADFRLR